MVKILEVKTKKQQKEFTMFPLKLYRNCEYYVPPFLCDERVIFDKEKNANLDRSEVVFYLAYNENNKVVGRIGGILHHTANEINNQKYLRFTRVDFIEDFEVAKALFEAVENWAKEKGMEYVHGPLGFNDFEREGLLVEGYDQLATFVENYNFPYYKDYIERLGYKKDVDWLEFKVYVPDEVDPRISKIAKMAEEKYNLHEISIKNKSKTIEKYKNQIFGLLDECYGSLYGFVPITKKLQEQLVGTFKLVVNKRYLCLVANEKEELVGLGLLFPEIARGMQKTGGKILTPKIFSLLKELSHPKVVDMVFFAVKPNYRTKGVTSFIFNKILNNLIEDKVEYSESTLQLETNIRIQNQFDAYKREQHKRRRCYIKKI